MTVSALDLRNSLVTSLLGTTGIQDWDYWGMAPDASFPQVGNVWPVSIDAPKPGRPLIVEFLAVAAVWAPSPNDLFPLISQLADNITSSYGPQSGCPDGLSNVISIELGALTIGAPSTSAASSVGLEGGSWAAISFTLTLTANG